MMKRLDLMKELVVLLGVVHYLLGYGSKDARCFGSSHRSIDRPS